uniref:Malonyl-CoA:ACP transacylase (MAT) domain-containing protein n=1 Tax=Timema douglasi TaxID=61478 RepID=A0A7R8VM44_TIMDO|nr:unnamed protein product [Timema douglasi]
MIKRGRIEGREGWRTLQTRGKVKFETHIEARSSFAKLREGGSGTLLSIFFAGRTRGRASLWPGVDAPSVSLLYFARAEVSSSQVSPYPDNLYSIPLKSEPTSMIALVDFMKLLDITPDGYIGHSVGELGCAYMDGCFTAEETLLAAYYRGLASNETELIPGYMAAIGLGYKDVKDLCPPEIDVACHNSSSSSTISGPEEIVKTFVNQLQKDNIFARAVNVANIAYHSRYIRPAAPKLLEYLKKLIIY